MLLNHHWRALTVSTGMACTMMIAMTETVRRQSYLGSLAFELPFPVFFLFFSVCLIQKTFLRRNTQDLMCSLSVQAKLHTHPHFLHVQGLRHSGFCPQ